MRRRAVGLAVVSACALSLVASSASAQSIVLEGATRLYPGAEASYVVSSPNTFTYEYTELTVVLPADVELLSVALRRETTGVETPLFPEATANCSATPPYACDPYFYAAVETDYTLTLSGGAFQTIQIDRAQITTGPWAYRVIVRLRVGSAAGCATPQPLTATFVEVGSGPTFAPVADYCALIDSIDAALPTGELAILGRAAAPEADAFTWRVHTTNSGVSGIPLLAAAQTSCVPADLCSGPTARFALASTGSHDELVTVTALNEPNDPPPGNVTVDLELSHAGQTYPGPSFVVAERPVTDLALDTVPAGRTMLVAEQPIDLVVARARNATQGFEPRTAARWRVVSSVVPVDPPAGWDPASWITPSGAGAATLVVPASAAAALVGSGEVTVTVTAEHDNPGGGFIEASYALTLNAEDLADCTLTADRPVLGIGQSTVVRAERIDSGGLRQPLADVSGWRVEPDLGELVVDAAALGTATYTTGNEPAAVTVFATPPVGVCAQLELSTTLVGEDDLDISLAVQPARVIAGQSVAFAIRAMNLSTTTDLGVDLELLVPKAVRLLRSGGAGPVGVGAAAAAWGGARPAFAIDLPASATRDLRPLALIAPGYCGKASVELLARRQGEVAILARQRVELEILCDPELNEATLFGKVFVDADGDGVQGEGEAGVAGAIVGTSASVWATTDTHGLYSIPKMAPGRVAVKLDDGSLPLGATVGTPTQLLTLTPGMFAPANFAVRLPALGSASLRVVGRRLVMSAAHGPALEVTLSAAAGRLVSAVSAAGVLEGRGADGETVFVLPLGRSTSRFGFVERANDGRVWLSALDLYAYTDDDGAGGAGSDAGAGVQIIPHGPHPLAALRLPPSTPVGRASLRVEGTLEPGVDVEISFAGGSRCQLGAADCVLLVAAPTDTLRVAVDAPAMYGGEDSPRWHADLPVQLDPSVHFFVALAGIEVGRVLDGAPTAAEDPVGILPRGAFFYRGRIRGTYLLTAGADLDRSIVVDADGKALAGGEIAVALLGHDPRRVFRDLDPEAYYPVYGDASVSVDEREAGGRFFVRLEAGDDFVKWGAFRTPLGGGEIGHYARSLYGAAARWRIGAAADPAQVGVAAFAARPDSSPARDILEVTGGSLYGLSRRPVVEGSVRVRLEALDEISGLPVRAVFLSEGADFEVDHNAGRLHLDPSVAHRRFAASLTGRGGARQRLVVTYEVVTAASAVADLAAGAEVSGRFGPAQLAVRGAAELPEREGGAQLERASYGLAAAELSVDLGAALRLRVEAAHSEGTSWQGQRSVDGGMSFGERPVRGGRPSGEALAVGLTSEIGGLRADAYGRFIEPGFSDARAAGGDKLVQGGARLVFTPTGALELFAQHDYRWQKGSLGPRRIEATSLLGGTARLGDLRLGLEGRHVYAPDEAAQRLWLGGLVGYQIFEGFELFVRRRQVLADGFGIAATPPAVSDTAVGGRLSDGGWALAADVGVDDRLRPFAEAEGRLPLDEETELYAGYARQSLLGEAGATALVEDAAGLDPAADRLVTGGRRRAGAGASLYAENALLFGAAPTGSRAVGATVSLTRGLVVGARYERGEIDPEGPRADERRDSGALSLSWITDRLQVRLAADGRYERGPNEPLAVWGLGGRLEWRVTQDLLAALGWRGSTAYAVESRPRIIAAAWEASAGLALRPRAWDTLNVFARYSLEHGRGAVAAAAALVEGGGVSEWTQRASLMAVWSLPWRLSLRPKVAFRHTDLFFAGGRARADVLLPALRAQWGFLPDWDIGLEGRMCSETGGTPRYGGLAELGVSLLGWLHLGGGYNLSSIDAGGVRCDEPGARGLFVRAEAYY